ncbi:Succinate dehydrogenase cytochrome b subunit [Sulfidibacter corallicola]|uniref:Succinate dehydrogenase cytochrome b subunit n=1 Tax=Sulfidibacter corallicola TaxID=2818388 RepID=A0A8A4TDX1_SULCO|nr:succinate dehydrogenase cytochrome b subunit [Sulfidibacter corallicola]QTD47757.1 succinate dehydrogenase cytochrome b subunit [Sulfidibacter corallicola]
MRWLVRFVNSSIGKKMLMAVTGILMSGWLVAHLTGNLLIFLGADAFNGYAEWLSHQPWLWPARLGLLAIFLIHVVYAIRLTMENNAARRAGYEYKDPSGASYAARTMILTGVLVIFYVGIHLLDFTFADKSGPMGLYGLVVEKLGNPLHALMYLGFLAVLGFHLSHGLQSVFQSMGLNHTVYTPLIKKLTLLGAVGLWLGFSAIPVYLMIKGGL